jgi:4-hydroxy-tetrahydrodipicolinate synthase
MNASPHHSLSGVYAAAVTPITADYSPDLDAVPVYLDFLYQNGCHGVLLFGTTGEGPSFSPEARLSVLRVAQDFLKHNPGFRLLFGVGTPALDETIALTRTAFELGVDAVVALPPYYFRNVTDEGLFLWFKTLLQRAVPDGGHLLGYHIPAVTGVPLSIDLLSHLKDAFPDRFAGIKDSSSDPNHAIHLGQHFGHDLLVLTGNDCLFSLALQSKASGCITAMANLSSPDLRFVWDAFQRGESTPQVQTRLDACRTVMEKYIFP